VKGNLGSDVWAVPREKEEEGEEEESVYGSSAELRCALQQPPMARRRPHARRLGAARECLHFISFRRAVYWSTGIVACLPSVRIYEYSNTNQRKDSANTGMLVVLSVFSGIVRLSIALAPYYRIHRVILGSTSRRDPMSSTAPASGLFEHR